MPYTQTYDKLTVISLTPEQHARTCNYWYVVAFTHKHHLMMWLEDRGLTLTQPLPEMQGLTASVLDVIIDTR